MRRSLLRYERILALSGVLGVSGALVSAAAVAYDPAHFKQLVDTRNCPKCDLSEAQLSGFTLSKADLSGANLTGAKMYRITLTQADLTDATLTDANLLGANLLAAKGAVLAGAKTDETTTCPDGAKGPCK